jgi:type VI protein secretion system component VasA
MAASKFKSPPDDCRHQRSGIALPVVDMSQTLSFQKPAFRTSSFFAVFSSVVARCLSQYMQFFCKTLLFGDQFEITNMF